MSQCKAKSKRTGKQCKRAAMHGKDVCYMHGGKSPGAKKQNKNAVTTGKYESIFPECMSPEELLHMENMDTAPLTILEEEIRVARIRESRILRRMKKAIEAEQVAGLPIAGEKDKKHPAMIPVSGVVSTGGPDGKTSSVNQESYFSHILKLEHALSDIQNLITRLLSKKAELLAEDGKGRGSMGNIQLFFSGRPTTGEKPGTGENSDA